MSLTSYRAAPPRVCLWGGLCRFPPDCGLADYCECMRCLFSYWVLGLFYVHGRPGGDLLSHALRRSTIGAEGFHGRVRDGIGCWDPRYGHQTVDERKRQRGREHDLIHAFQPPYPLLTGIWAHM